MYGVTYLGTFFWLCMGHRLAALVNREGNASWVAFLLRAGVRVRGGGCCG